MGRRRSFTCKYGHPKIGDNLLLRLRTAVVTSPNHNKKYSYDNVTERVCVTCLNQQIADYSRRQEHRDDSKTKRLYDIQLHHGLTAQSQSTKQGR